MARRVIDIIIASALLLLVCPALGLITVLIRITMGRPVLFQQVRPGIEGRPFRLLKFRTMSTACDERGRPLADADRLTLLGVWLRKMSLDELPQLWNVLKGDMSLVGPRPLLPEYLPRYTARQRRRHEVKPGITGWAQVNGRNGLSWEQKFELDVWYVEHRSLWLDFKILWLTVLQVLRRNGISQQGHVTMPEFTGGGSRPLI